MNKKLNALSIFFNEILVSNKIENQLFSKLIYNAMTYLKKIVAVYQKGKTL